MCSSVVPVPGVPHRVSWTDHAFEKAALLGIAPADLERMLIEHHRVRRRNSGSADWRVNVGRLTIVYVHPDDGDGSTIRLVTLWRRR